MYVDYRCLHKDNVILRRCPVIFKSGIIFYFVRRKTIEASVSSYWAKLATLKLKKVIYRQQEHLEVQTNRGDAGQLRRQLDCLQQTIELGEWGDDDKPFKREQAKRLIV